MATAGDGHLASVTGITPRLDADTAESRFISSLIETGSYIPSAYGIADGMFALHRQVHTMCTEHQAKVGRAPTPDYVTSRYPKFPYTSGNALLWAAHEMLAAWQDRVLREHTYKAMGLLNGGDVEAARAALTEGVRVTMAESGEEAYDGYTVEEAEHAECVPVPGALLQRATGGIRQGGVWYIAARSKVGKSWRLVEHAVEAVKAGWDVHYFSLEMPAHELAERFQQIAIKPMWRMPWGEIGIDRRTELVEQWRHGKGNLSIYDQTTGKMSPNRIYTVASERSLVIIDHVGLMRASSGSRIIDDWRVAATMSNELVEAAAECMIPILGAVQLNKSNEISQTIAFEQDATVVVRMTAESRRVRRNEITFNRYGESDVHYYTSFVPAVTSFGEIDGQTALSMIAEDGDE